jgi:hypothetical protein
MIGVPESLKPVVFLAHHSEPGDPDLLEWIRHQIDTMLGLGPLYIVVLLGIVVLAIPLGITVLFLLNRRRGARS